MKMIHTTMSMKDSVKAFDPKKPSCPKCGKKNYYKISGTSVMCRSCLTRIFSNQYKKIIKEPIPQFMTEPQVGWNQLVVDKMGPLVFASVPVDLCVKKREENTKESLLEKGRDLKRYILETPGILSNAYYLNLYSLLSSLVY
jgi:ribosomal protein L37AE/L43A